MNGPSLILRGANLLPYDLDNPYLAGGAVNTVGANLVTLALTRVAAPLTIANMALWVGTAAGNVDLGYYTDDDADGTYTRETHTGSTAAAGSSVKQQIALATPIVLAPNRNYWRAFITDSGTLTTWRAGGVSVFNLAPLLNLSASVTYATAPGLPATLSGLAIATTRIATAGLP